MCGAILFLQQIIVEIERKINHTRKLTLVQQIQHHQQKEEATDKYYDNFPRSMKLPVDKYGSLIPG